MTATDYGLQPSGYRLPAATHIGRVVLQVSNLDHSADFYRDFLGFEEIARAAETISLGVDGRVLIELRAGASGPLHARRLGLYHFAILLPDRASLGRALEHLVGSGMQPGASDHLVSEALYISDPDGLGIEIYRDRAREEWQVTDRQLAMASEPLDFDAVMAASDGEAWAGMPSGTVIGHVHLHVGDIEAARAFYHEGVGLDVMVWNYPGALFLAAGGYHHQLGTNTWAGPGAAPARADEPQLLMWQLVLPDPEQVAAAASQLAQAGYAVTPEEAGGSVANDPWGIALQLTAAA